MILFLLSALRADVIGEKSGQELTLSGTGQVNSTLIGLYTPSSLKSVVVLNGPNEIASNCFSACTSLTSITLSNTILYIRSGAFRNTKLVSLNIPESVISVDPSYLFYLSSTLKSITVSSSNQYYSSYDGCLYNFNKSRLVLIPNGKTSVELYDGVVTLGAWSMYLLSSRTIIVPDSVEYIETQSAVDTRGLYHLYFSPTSNLKTMPRQCIYLTGLRNFTCPVNVTSIGVSAFYQNYQMQFFDFYPGSKLEVISDTAFIDCTSLVSISLPSTVKQISSTAFSGCNALKTVNVNSPYFNSVNGVVYNEDYSSIVFIPNAVTEFSISSNLENIYQSSLQRCVNLTDIKCDPNNVHFFAHKGVVYDKDTREALYAAGGLVDVIIVANSTAIGASIFTGLTKLQTFSFEDESVCSIIKSNAFKDSTVVSVSLAPTITQIESRAFHTCNNLQSIILPRDLQIIQVYSFKSCSSLKSVTYMEGCVLKTIVSDSFSDCKSLTIVELPDTVSVIQNSAFESSNISSIKLPKSLTSLLSSAFGECHNLARVYIDQSCPLKVISSKCFAQCTKLESIQINSVLTTIEGEAFSGCISLTSVEYLGESSLKTIASESFKGCTSLPNFNITSSLTSFFPSTFANCIRLQNYFVDSNSNLKSIDGIIFSSDERTIVAFPPGRKSGSVKSGTYKIGDEAFYGCSVLEELEFDAPSNVDTIGGYSFSGCSSLSYLKIPSSVSLIEENAFQSCTELSTVTFASGSLLGILKSTVFKGCTKISQIIFEEGSNLKTIEENALAGLPIVSFKVPAKVSFIGENCFQECTKLERVDFDNSSPLTEISKECFSGCSKLSLFNFSTKITIIADSAFKGCNFASIEFGANIEEIKESAFENNYNLKMIKLSINIVSLEKNCFSNCGDLLEVFYCGYSHFTDDAFGTNLQPSVKVAIYTMNTYQFNVLSGQPVLKVMRKCGLLPTSMFTNVIGYRSSSLFIETLIASQEN